MIAKEFETLLTVCEASSLDYFKFSNGEEEIMFRKTPGILAEEEEVPSQKIIQRSSDLYREYADTNDASIKSAHSEEEKDNELVTVYSDYIGIATYSELLKSTGDILVSKGDVLCTVEAMKIYSDVISKVDGVIVEIFFKDGDMIECEQELFKIKEKEYGQI